MASPEKIKIAAVGLDIAAQVLLMGQGNRNVLIGAGAVRFPGTASQEQNGQEKQYSRPSCFPAQEKTRPAKSSKLGHGRKANILFMDINFRWEDKIFFHSMHILGSIIKQILDSMADIILDLIKGTISIYSGYTEMGKRCKEIGNPAQLIQLFKIIEGFTTQITDAGNTFFRIHLEKQHQIRLWGKAVGSENSIRITTGRPLVGGGGKIITVREDYFPLFKGRFNQIPDMLAAVIDKEFELLF
jgi:prepilin-type processing-associated H-X9-DG protein